jgi:hypothetical protein
MIHTGMFVKNVECEEGAKIGQAGHITFMVASRGVYRLLVGET